MPNYYIVIDLEMNPTVEPTHNAINGLSSETIEIGAVKIDAVTNSVIDEFSSIVRPQMNHRIEPRITKLTGITTREVSQGDIFEVAMTHFLDWVGCEPVQVYSWSKSDLNQLINECAVKHVVFPDTFHDWIDFQAEYPKYLGYSERKCLSLKKAARLIGTAPVSGRAHRALYDAQITSQLVLFALTGEYKHYISKVDQHFDSKQKAMTYSIGEACGSKLALLLSRIKDNEEMEVC